MIWVAHKLGLASTKELLDLLGTLTMIVFAWQMYRIERHRDKREAEAIQRRSIKNYFNRATELGTSEGRIQKAVLEISRKYNLTRPEFVEIMEEMGEENPHFPSSGRILELADLIHVKFRGEDKGPPTKS